MHANEELLQKFQNETMEPEEMIAFLSHLEECDFCLNELANIQECTSPVQAPSYLKEQILERAKEPDIQAAITMRNTSRKMELFFYGLRTAAGVIAALFLLFSMNHIDLSNLSALIPRPESSQEYMEQADENRPPDKDKGIYDFSQSISSHLSRGMNNFTDSINGFTNKILNGGK